MTRRPALVAVFATTASLSACAAGERPANRQCAERCKVRLGADCNVSFERAESVCVEQVCPTATRQELACFMGAGCNVHRTQLEMGRLACGIEPSSESCETVPDSPYCLERAPQDPSFIDDSSRVPFVNPSRDGSGGGIVWLDYDRDGDPDLLAVNGAGGEHALFRNDGGGKFTDVAARAGLDEPVSGAGASAADIDNDGYTDLFISGTTHRLYHNEGDGTFRDITVAAGLDDLPQSVRSVTFGDFDNDGHVDLFLGAMGRGSTPPETSKLFRNGGDLTFQDVSEGSGLGGSSGVCAAMAGHVDDDGRLDLFVANCAGGPGGPRPLQVYRNEGGLTFSDVRERLQMAERGWWMGLARADFDGDGQLDLFSTNLGTIGHGPAGRTEHFAVGVEGPETDLHALWLSADGDDYVNRADAAGLARWEFGRGCSAEDFDADGRMDLVFTGASPGEDRIGAGRGHPTRVYMNNGDGTFGVSNPPLPIDTSELSGAGLATADYDGDGNVDIAISAVGSQSGDVDGKLFLLRNGGNGNHSVTLRLRGTDSNADAIGAAVRVVTPEREVVREIAAGSSYLSQNSQHLTIGLGSEERAVVEVRWPSGLRERFQVRAGRAWLLTEGEGRTVYNR